MYFVAEIIIKCPIRVRKMLMLNFNINPQKSYDVNNSFKTKLEVYFIA